MQKTTLSTIRDSLLGGAIGDALGCPIEFNSPETIRSRCGKAGLEHLLPDGRSGRALLLDDTQMTLFAANGLLFAPVRLGEDAAALYDADPNWARKYCECIWKAVA